jgi:hypothetical protein
MLMNYKFSVSTLLLLATSVCADECVDIGNAILNTEFRGGIKLYDAPTDISFWKEKAEECSQTNKRFNWSYILNQDVYKYTPEKIQKKINENFEYQSNHYKNVESRILSNFSSLQAGNPTSYEIEIFSRQKITPNSKQIMHPKVHEMYKKLEVKRLELLSQLQNNSNKSVSPETQPNSSKVAFVEPNKGQPSSNINNESHSKVYSQDAQFVRQLSSNRKRLEMKVALGDLAALKRVNVTPALIHNASPEVQAKFKALEEDKSIEINKLTKKIRQQNEQVEILSSTGQSYLQNIEKQFNEAEEVLSSLDDLELPINAINQVKLKIEKLLSNRDLRLEAELSKSKNRQHSFLSANIKMTISSIEMLKNNINSLITKYEKKEKDLIAQRLKEKEERILREKLPKILEVAEHSLLNSNPMPFDNNNIVEYMKRTKGNQNKITLRLMEQAKVKDSEAQRKAVKLLYVEAIKSMGYNFDDTVKSAVFKLADGDVSPFNRDVLLGVASFISLTDDAKDTLLSFGFITQDTYNLLEVSHLIVRN